MKKIAAFILLCSICSSLLGQENLGIASSNWAVTNAMRLNPAAMVDPKPWLDINVLGGSFFATNNYAFLPADSFSIANSAGGNTPDAQSRTTGGNVNLLINLALWGPAANLSKGKHSFGAHVAFRNYNNVRKVPVTIANFAFEGLDYLPQRGTQFDEGGFNLKTMSWVEVGFSYGRILQQFHKDMWMAGATLKRLIGIHHGALLFDNANFVVLDSVNAQAFDIDGRYAYATPGWNRGGGWSLDAGVIYKKMLEDITKYIPHSIRSRCKIPEYKYKIGFSILDLGYLRFRNEAQVRELSNASTIWNNFDNTDLSDFQTLDQEVLSRFSDADISSGNSFTALLPTALSAQIDYNFENDFYISGVIMQRIGRPGNLGVERANLLGITPRYERRFFEASVPVWLYNYTSPRIGLGLRLSNLILGTDNIIPYLFNVDVSNIDFYFGLRFSLYKAPECRNVRRKSRKVLCPAPAY